MTRLCAPCSKRLRRPIDPRPHWHVGTPCGGCGRQAVMVGRVAGDLAAALSGDRLGHGIGASA